MQVQTTNSVGMWQFHQNQKTLKNDKIDSRTHGEYQRWITTNNSDVFPTILHQGTDPYTLPQGMSKEPGLCGLMKAQKSQGHADLREHNVYRTGTANKKVHLLNPTRYNGLQLGAHQLVQILLVRQKQLEKDSPPPNHILKLGIIQYASFFHQLFLCSTCRNLKE